MSTVCLQRPPLLLPKRRNLNFTLRVPIRAGLWKRWLCCNTLQHAATAATHSHSLWHNSTAPFTSIQKENPDFHFAGASSGWQMGKRWTHCNTLQHAATHCNTLQHTVTQCNCSLYLCPEGEPRVSLCVSLFWVGSTRGASMYIYMYTHTHVYIYIHMYKDRYIYAYIWIHICTLYKYSYMHAYIYIHVYVCTYG